MPVFNKKMSLPPAFEQYLPNRKLPIFPFLAFKLPGSAPATPSLIRPSRSYPQTQRIFTKLHPYNCPHPTSSAACRTSSRTPLSSLFNAHTSPVLEENGSQLQQCCSGFGLLPSGMFKPAGSMLLITCKRGLTEKIHHYFKPPFYHYLIRRGWKMFRSMGLSAYKNFRLSSRRNGWLMNMNF